MGEFELIRRYFTRPGPATNDCVVLGVGDDCALIQPRPGTRLAISTDMLVADRHFFADVDPYTLGHKALAVNLSDLAACGARPLAFTLALALPRADARWLDGFSQGLFALADAHSCSLIGGDTTRGPLTIAITIWGEIDHSPLRPPLLRSAAQAGDDIYVSGTLGEAHAALQSLRGAWQLPPDTVATLRQRLEQPTPRVALGLALRGIAHAAADVSDGLCADLGHILTQSGVGACLQTVALLPLLQAPLNDSQRLHSICHGGDDYELVFTASPARRAAIAAAAQACATPVTRIGTIESTPGLRLLDADHRPLSIPGAGFDHFAPSCA